MRAFTEAFLAVELHIYITIAWHRMIKYLLPGEN